MNSSTVFGKVESVNSSDADSTSSSNSSNYHHQFRQQVSDYITDFNHTTPTIPPPLFANVTSDEPLIDFSKATVSIPSFARNPVSFDPFSTSPSTSELHNSGSLPSISNNIPQYLTPAPPQYVPTVNASTNSPFIPKSRFGANSQIDLLSGNNTVDCPKFNPEHTHFGIKCVSSSFVHYTSSFKELCEKLIYVPHPIWLAFGSFGECSRWLRDNSRIEGYTTDHIDMCPWVQSPSPDPPTPTGLSTQDLIHALSAVTPAPVPQPYVPPQSNEFVLKKEKSKDFDLDSVNLTSHPYKWYDLKKQISIQATKNKEEHLLLSLVTTSENADFSKRLGAGLLESINSTYLNIHAPAEQHQYYINHGLELYHNIMRDMERLHLFAGNNNLFREEAKKPYNKLSRSSTQSLQSWISQCINTTQKSYPASVYGQEKHLERVITAIITKSGTQFDDFRRNLARTNKQYSTILELKIDMERELSLNSPSVPQYNSANHVVADDVPVPSPASQIPPEPITEISSIQNQSANQVSTPSNNNNNTSSNNNNNNNNNNNTTSNNNTNNNNGTVRRNDPRHPDFRLTSTNGRQAQMQFAAANNRCILCNSEEHTFDNCPCHPNNNNNCKSSTVPLSSVSSSSSCHDKSSSHNIRSNHLHLFQQTESDELTVASLPLHQMVEHDDISCTCLSLPNIPFPSGPNWKSTLPPPVPLSINLSSNSVDNSTITHVCLNNNKSIINTKTKISDNLSNNSTTNNPSSDDPSTSDTLSTKEISSFSSSYSSILSHLEDLETFLSSIEDPHCVGVAMHVPYVHLNNKIIADSGATCHMNPHRSCFINLVETPEAYVSTANGEQLPATHIGSTIQKIGGSVVILQNVLLVPSLRNPLFSIRSFRKNKECSFIANDTGVTLNFPNVTLNINDDEEMALDFESVPTSYARRLCHYIEPPFTDDHNGINFANVMMTRSRKQKQRQLLTPCINFSTASPHTRVKKVTFSSDTITHTSSSFQKYYSSIHHSLSEFHVGDKVTVHYPPFQSYDTLVIKYKLNKDDPETSHCEYQVRLPNGLLTHLSRDQLETPSPSSLPSPNTIENKIEPPEAPAIDISSDTIKLAQEIIQDHEAQSTDSPEVNQQIMTPDEIQALNVLLKNVQRSYEKYGCITPKVQENLEKYYDKKVFKKHSKPSSQTPDDRDFFIPPHYKRNSAEPKYVRMTHQELYNLLGCRNLKNWESVKEVAEDNLHLVNVGEPITEIGEVANIKRSRRNKTPVPRPATLFNTMHLDIGYADVPAIGGTAYALLLVDRTGRMSFVYSLTDLSHRSIISALSELHTEIGCFPKRILTDFDHKLLGQEVSSWLALQNCQIHGAPGGRQDENGLVESTWKSLVHMSRAYLTNKQMPREYWFWALRNASHARNMMPITVDGVKTSSYELTYGKKPDYGLLTPIFSTATIGQHRDGSVRRGNFQSQSMQAILLGRSSECDGYLLYSPFTKKFYNRTDVKIDKGRHTPNAFNLQYDGGLFIGLFDGNTSTHNVEVYPAGTTVHYVKPDGVRIKGTVTSTPVPLHNSVDIPHQKGEQMYNVRLVTGEHVTIPMAIMPDFVDLQETTDDIDETQQTLLPGWAHSNSKVQILKNGKYVRGWLHFDEDTIKWSFEQRKRNGQVTDSTPIPNFISEFMSLIEAGELIPGWKNTTQFNSTTLKHIHSANHVSAANLKNIMAPTSLAKAIDQNNPDHLTWMAAYKEEFEALVSMGTFSIISQEEYTDLLVKQRIKRAIPTMNVFTIKKTNGVPTRAKSRIVVLGNLDPREWSKSDCLAPVISQTSVRLLTALAVRSNCTLKQGDCKNAFVQASLPDEELTVCKPPVGCPYSKGNKFWLLHKSLYGLRRAPRHWYDLCTSYLNQCGLTATKTDRCLYSGNPIEGKAPLYLGMYVDDFIYYSEDPEVEIAFEKKFAELTKVDYMGQVEWYLGINFRWSRDNDDRVSCFLSQEGYSDLIVDRMDLQDANPVKSPYRSGLPIDSLPESKLKEEEQHAITHLYRQYLGMIGWISISTRPDLATAYSLLASYMAKPSKQHLESAKYVGKYIKGTRDYGITFSNVENEELNSFAHIPIPKNSPTSFTDSNWGPQDASTSFKGKPRKVSMMEPKSVLGFITMLSGGPIAWKSKKEKRTSLSSCEAEIKGINECAKNIEYIRNLLTELGFPCVHPTPIYNDNKGGVQWSNGYSNKNMRHVNIRENYVREAIHEVHTISVQHIPGKNNVSDIFTKETKSATLFCEQRDLLVSRWSPAKQGGCLDHVPGP